MAKERVILTPHDWERARILQGQELIEPPLDEQKMFLAGVYCILSAQERHEKQLRIYQELIDAGIIDHKSARENASIVKAIVKEARFPNNKFDRLMAFADWCGYKGYSLYPLREIIYDANSIRREEFSIRQGIANQRIGLGMKGASLFMNKCGYENVVPLDIWILRFLETSPPRSNREYVEVEDSFREIARKEYGVNPALLQFALWAKFSGWYDRTKLPKQIEMFQ